MKSVHGLSTNTLSDVAFIRCSHLLATEKIRALVDNIRGKKDRIIDGEVVKKDDGDG